MKAIEFKYHNGGSTSTAKNRGDCVARAIAIVTGADYQAVFNELNRLGKTHERKGKKKGGISNARTGVFKQTIHRYMTAVGWEWVPTMGIGTGCRTHLRADELPAGRIIVALSKHVAAVIDGVLHDTNDCSRDGTRCVYGYWKEPAKEEKMTPKEALQEMMNNKKLDNNIVQFFHCGLCADELPKGMSPQEWVRNESGWTTDGFQVWCMRHQCNVIHMDFEGAKHPAHTERKPTREEAKAELELARDKVLEEMVKGAGNDEQSDEQFDKDCDNLHTRLMNALARFHPVVGQAVLPMAAAEILLVLNENDLEKATKDAKEFHEDILRCMGHMKEEEEKPGEHLHS